MPSIHKLAERVRRGLGIEDARVPHEHTSSCPERVPQAIGILPSLVASVCLGPGVRAEEGLLCEPDRLEDLAGPEDIGAGIVLFRTKPLNEPRCLGCLCVANEQDTDPGSGLEGIDKPVRDTVVG
jgi:hypothetical protein